MKYCQADFFGACGCLSHNGFLTRRGYERVNRTNTEGVDKTEESRYLDRVGSVSALAEAEDLYAFCSDLHLDQQGRRHQHGW